VTYCGQYVNMEVDTIRPSARRTCVWHNYSNLGCISLDVHVVWQVVCKTRACSRAWNYTPYIQVTRSLRRYVRAYNTSADQRARGSATGRKPLPRNFVNGPAVRAISVIKCWMCTWRRNCVFTRALIHTALMLPSLMLQQPIRIR